VNNNQTFHKLQSLFEDWLLIQRRLSYLLVLRQLVWMLQKNFFWNGWVCLWRSKGTP